MHLSGFDKAVKRYRQRADRARVSAQIKKATHSQERKGAEVEASRAHEASLSPTNTMLPAESSTRSMGNIIGDELNHTAVYESRVAAQDTLEALPFQVLSLAKAFQDYVRFSEEGAAALDDHHNHIGSGSSRDETQEITNGLRSLLDEIAGAGALISNATKDVILKDNDARHVRAIPCPYR